MKGKVEVYLVTFVGKRNAAFCAAGDVNDPHRRPTGRRAGRVDALLGRLNVADGMGGHGADDIAVATAKEHLLSLRRVKTQVLSGVIENLQLRIV